LKIIIILLALSLSACAKHNSGKNHIAHKHLSKKGQIDPNHTQKLVRGLNISFISQNEVRIETGSEDIKTLEVKIFHKSPTGKTLVLEKNIESSGTVEFDLDEELAVDGQTLAAVVKATDSKGQVFSSVESYLIGYQDEINSLKSNKLKN